MTERQGRQDALAPVRPGALNSGTVYPHAILDCSWVPEIQIISRGRILTSSSQLKALRSWVKCAQVGEERNKVFHGLFGFTLNAQAPFLAVVVQPKPLSTDYILHNSLGFGQFGKDVQLDGFPNKDGSSFLSIHREVSIRIAGVIPVIARPEG